MNGVLKVVAQLSDADLAAPSATEASAIAASPAAPTRSFVKLWETADFVDAFDAGWDQRRNPSNGRAVLEAAGCIQCHAFRGLGQPSAPDLSAVGTKFRDAALLKQLLEPSAVILDGYEQHLFFLKDGRDVVGRILKEEAAAFHVAADLRQPDAITVVPKTDIARQKKSSLSAMPTGLLVTFTRDEILDLLALLQSPVPGEKP
jgi:putative heme-binding domain-containing protein